MLPPPGPATRPATERKEACCGYPAPGPGRSDVGPRASDRQRTHSSQGRPSRGRPARDWPRAPPAPRHVADMADPDRGRPAVCTLPRPARPSRTECRDDPAPPPVTALYGCLATLRPSGPAREAPGIEVVQPRSVSAHHQEVMLDCSPAPRPPAALRTGH